MTWDSIPVSRAIGALSTHLDNPTLFYLKSAGRLCARANPVEKKNYECPGYETKLYLVVRSQSWSLVNVEYALHGHYFQVRFGLE